MVAAKLRTFRCTPNKTLLALPSVAGTLTRGLTHFVRILAHVLAPQSLALCFSGEQVYLGDWDKSLVRSLLTSSLLLPAIFLIGADNLQSSEIPGLIATFSLYIGVFLLVSIAGWLIIGFPVHWLACKYKKTNYLFYMVLPVTFSLVSGTTNGPWILGVIASVQALIFRYVVFKNKT